MSGSHSACQSSRLEPVHAQHTLFNAEPQPAPQDNQASSPPEDAAKANREGWIDYASNNFPTVKRDEVTKSRGKIHLGHNEHPDKTPGEGEAAQYFRDKTPRAETANAEKAADKAGDGKKKKTLLVQVKDLAFELVKIVVFVLLLRAYVLQMSSVEGQSMEPTLHNGDYLLVERLTVSMNNMPDWLKPMVPGFMMPSIERGDIVVISSPENGNNELVKRVIAIGGDRIFFNSDTGSIWVNGVEQEERYLSRDLLKELDKAPNGGQRRYHPSDLPDRMPHQYRVDKDDFDDAKREGRIEKLGAEIPAGCLFVVGDNRKASHSNDSRAWSGIRIGKSSPGSNVQNEDHLWVTEKNVHGIVLFRLLPPWEYSAAKPFVVR